MAHNYRGYHMLWISFSLFGPLYMTTSWHPCLTTYPWLFEVQFVILYNNKRPWCWHGFISILTELVLDSNGSGQLWRLCGCWPCSELWAVARYQGKAFLLIFCVLIWATVPTDLVPLTAVFTSNSACIQSLINMEDVDFLIAQTNIDLVGTTPLDVSW